MCRALQWSPDSIQRVLEGGEPTVAVIAHAGHASGTRTTHGAVAQVLPRVTLPPPLATSGSDGPMTPEFRSELERIVAETVRRVMREEGKE